MAGASGLEPLDDFLNDILGSIAPGERKRLMEKLLRIARRANAARIAANVTPGGGAMAPRKKRIGGKRGKMFKRIGKADSLKTHATPDLGELRFANPLVEATAATHHYGLEGFVGKTRSGRVIRTKYQARELIGFGAERDEFLDAAIAHLTGS